MSDIDLPSMILNEIRDVKNEMRDMKGHMSNIDVTLGKQEVSLAEHIRRTALLEVAIEPIKKHVAMVKGALKLVGILLTMIGIAATYWAKG